MEISGNILIVDDDPDIAQSARIILRPFFKSVITENNPQAIAFTINQKNIDVVLLDMNYTPGVTKGSEGLFWLNRITNEFPQVSVIMITAYGEIKLAVEAIKTGAVDFVVKPWENEKLIATVTSARQLAHSKKELDRTKTRQSRINELNISSDSLPIGMSGSMKNVLSMIDKVSGTDASVLLLGENGTGKEVVAKAIHRASLRSSGQFIKVDLGSITPTLFESEMFGHKRGAFTDAKQDHVGRFELASGGTLFLDELGNLPVTQQSKLLTVLQNREVTPLGSTTPLPVDIRLISATNQSLEEMIAEGTFREDLLYRLNTVTIVLPPLRERTSDIPLLINYFLDLYTRKYQKTLKVSSGAMEKLQHYSWPGNIRELQHATERAVIMSEGKTLKPEDFMLSSNRHKLTKLKGLNLDDVERNTIREAIQKHNGNLTLAAQELGLGRTTLYRKIQKYGLQK